MEAKIGKKNVTIEILYLKVVARTVAARPLHAPSTVQYALEEPRGPPAAGAGPPGPLSSRRRRERKWVFKTILATYKRIRKINEQKDTGERSKREREKGGITVK